MQSLATSEGNPEKGRGVPGICGGRAAAFTGGGGGFSHGRVPTSARRTLCP